MKKKKVLLVDDNRDLADGMAAVFNLEGIHADVTYSAASGMEAILSVDYDFIFLDAKLPDKNGIKLYGEIHRKKPGVVIALITGYRIEQLLSQFVTDGSVEATRCSNNSDLKESIIGLKNNDIRVIRCQGDDEVSAITKIIKSIGKSANRTVIGLNIDNNPGTVQPEPGDIFVFDTKSSLLNIFDFYLALKDNGNQCATIILQRGGTKVIDVMESFSATKCIFKPFATEDLVKIVNETNTAAA